MKRLSTFAEGLGAGAFLISLLAAATCFWKPGVLVSWLSNDTEETRARRNWERAERTAKFSADYVDICRAAGL